MTNIMKPNFNKMSKTQLRAYVLTHKDDKEAFNLLVDRFKADSAKQVRHPFPKSLEDVVRVQKLVHEHIKNLEEL